MSALIKFNLKGDYQMLHIRKIKTLYGLRYAVVDKFTSTTKDINGNQVTTTNYHSVDYKVGKENFPAIFPLTDEGLEDAKEVQKLYKK